MSADASDLSLVRRVQRGDKGAFDALVLKYQHKLVKLVMRYVRNPAEAEDIAQEAFIKAYRALPQFRGDSAFYTWLYRIAINTAKNAVVSRDRSPVEYDLDRNNNEESYDMQGRMKDSETPEGLVLTDGSSRGFPTRRLLPRWTARWARCARASSVHAKRSTGGCGKYSKAASAARRSWDERGARQSAVRNVR